MGHIENYEDFLTELDKVWGHCFRALVPGGRLICGVGDVCLSRRKNNGRHTVVPLHASIQEHCRKLGFDKAIDTGHTEPRSPHGDTVQSVAGSPCSWTVAGLAT